MIKHLLPALVLLMATAVGAAEIWPTEVSSGDCAAAERIHAEKTAYNREADRTYCKNGNPGDSQREALCLANTATRDGVTFVSNRCGDKNDPIFVSLNGKEYAVKRTSTPRRAAPFLPGTYAGDGIGVSIKLGHLLNRDYEPGTPRREENLVYTRYAVSVEIQRDRVRKTVQGVLGFGR